MIYYYSCSSTIRCTSQTCCNKVYQAELNQAYSNKNHCGSYLVARAVVSPVLGHLYLVARAVVSSVLGHLSGPGLKPF